MTRFGLFALFLTAGCPAVDEAAFEARVDLDGDGARAEAFGGDDCDDSDAAIHPGADDAWYDDVDQNCDKAPDFDQDGDGWDGNMDGAGGDDCDDTDPSVHPEAVELCDGIDQDCAGGAVGEEDADGDGWRACAEDCDDDDPAVNPDAGEVCDAADRDEDCDGASDDADTLPQGVTRWHPDEDDDGYGDPAVSTDACERPAGFTIDDSDCDDTDRDLNPDTAWHPDADRDGWGDADTSMYQCASSDGLVRDGGDCDDTDTSVSPEALERCNEVDDDCDGRIDDDDDDVDPAEAVWYRDADRDGSGDAAYRVVSCAGSATYVHVSGDCDDDDATAYPGGPETCDTVDNDCDALVDDADPDILDPVLWYPDTDGDGWGEAATGTLACGPPSGWVADPGDCDDADPVAHPYATETCDGIDEDCDGLVDDDDPDVSDQVVWYADADADTWGDTSSDQLACSGPAGFVAVDGDCDDVDAAVHPGATETCSTAHDDDCDGVANGDDAAGCTALGLDEDLDGFGDGQTRCLCAADAAWTATIDGDCDDTEPNVHPGATETCATSADDDCDGVADALDAPGCGTWYLDADGDLHGVATSECRCAASGAYSATVADDCDDGAAEVWPGAPVSCLDGVNQDCDAAPDACDLSDADVTFEGEAAADLSGVEVHAGQDFDGDGLPDLLVGAIGESSAGASSGAVYLVSGATPGTSSLSASIAKLRLREGGYGGDEFASVGDVDGDGEGDVLLGAYGADERAYEGAAYLFLGPFSGTEGASSAETILVGESYGDYAGYDVAAAGDTDGDGLADLLVGSVYVDWYRTNSGQVSLVTSATTGLNDLGYATANLWGASLYDYLGYASAGLGDVDGDGLDDIAVGTPYADTGGTSTGVVYVVHAPISGFGRVTTYADATIVGTTGMVVGTVVAGVGDLDGDGLGDVGTTGSGMIHVYAGSSAGTVAVGASMVRVDGTDSLTSFDAAGDVDGDGGADLVVGSPGDDTNGVDAGIAYVLLGAFSGVVDPDTGDSELLGPGASDYAGYGVAGVGDVDGDGLDDVAVGAPDASYASGGSTYLVFGGG